MEIASLRPKLVSLRATSFHGENKAVSSGNEPWNIQLTQTIEVGLGAAKDVAAPLQAIVKIDLLAKASKAGAEDQLAEFSGSYEARFDYPATATEAQILPLFEHEPYQYVLVAQAFPLAMTHFRREMQSMGFDARELPLGI
ncbi:hypothetical protein [Polaromonas sp.]|uniref:hypothetical protein n=1 Tax=Polaromonas sp. TaxID=1869339 RepID=UPI00286BA90A|nr:hypothetical protein [Polaromonas sp.]